MKRAIALLALSLLAAPAFAQEGEPAPAAHERANEPLQQVLPDQFADDGTYHEDAWGEDWGEDWDAAEAEWESHHGEAHEEAHFSWQELFAQVINFILWLAIIIYLAKKPLSDFLAGRRMSVEEGLVEAKNLKEAAEAKHADYSERLERLDEELEKLRTEMVQAGEAERDRIIADAESRATRMRADAKFVIEQQMKQLRADLTREAIEAAMSAAERVLTEQVKEADQTRLAQEYLEGLEVTMKDETGVQA
ncbi:MAG: ATP synthase F0 subunit B [Sandaracinaceae bacterium]|nr:ATP synthase F0 subunit B [Sandaracinaceae bacterium]